MQILFDPYYLVAFLFGTVRCAAWLVITPPFQGAVPARVRGGLAVALGLAMAPRLKQQGIGDLGSWSLILGVFHQALIGLSLGLLVFVLFQAFAGAGAMIDYFAGLTAGNIYDPLSASANGPVSRLYQLIGTTVIFLTNGHLVILGGLSRSFDLSFANGFHIDRLGVLLTRDVLTYLTAALQIAAPILAALFVTELLLGLATRAAPKLNIMILGFGVKSLVTFMLLGAALPLVAYVSISLVRNAMDSMAALLAGG
ncbi:MAG: flagellar biosynthetic protein FliR [Microthrixaceae bacterium]